MLFNTVTTLCYVTQDIRSFFKVTGGGAKNPSSTTQVSARVPTKLITKKKTVIRSSDEDDDDPPAIKNKKTTPPSNKRRIVYSDDEDDNNTPTRKKVNLSKPVVVAVKPKDQPKLKLVEDVSDVFGDAPIKRVDKPTVNTNKTMTEDELNEHFMDDLDISAVPDPDVLDVNVNKINGRAKNDEDGVEPMDESVIEGTPKGNKQKERNDKKKSAKKASLDSSKFRF